MESKKEAQEQYELAKKLTEHSLLEMGEALQTLRKAHFADYPGYDPDDEEGSVEKEATWHINQAKSLMGLAVGHLAAAGENILTDDPSPHHVIPLEVERTWSVAMFLAPEGGELKLFDIFRQVHS